MGLTVTLTSCAAAAVMSFWLAMRVAALRGKFRVAHGDGDNEYIARRMRAQLNFVENTPFVLLLIAAIELSGKAGLWLSYVAAIYFLGRLAHAIGMDSAEVPLTRKVGMGITFLTLLGLAVVALLIALGYF